MPAPDRTAAAFSPGASAMTIVSDEAGGRQEVDGAAEAEEDVRAVRAAPPCAPTSSTRPGRAVAAATCSSSRTVSVPAPRSRRTGGSARMRGAAVSPATSSPNPGGPR